MRGSKTSRGEQASPAFTGSHKLDGMKHHFGRYRLDINRIADFPMFGVQRGGYGQPGWFIFLWRWVWWLRKQ